MLCISPDHHCICFYACVLIHRLQVFLVVKQKCLDDHAVDVDEEPKKEETIHVANDEITVQELVAKVEMAPEEVLPTKETIVDKEMEKTVELLMWRCL
ncbi:hypothetical protein MUK42_37317 [Musa troglodytarum]|uniref:Uncharacterized protein n=1 Tax=Musa troglodytarum TaxID=320322 RepID=A0A9E7JDW2_9LILI|nr:hypothetical protein MUK42_37317 [Musa troglodytarum]